jgi:hypothetical protein
MKIIIFKPKSFLLGYLFNGGIIVFLLFIMVLTLKFSKVPSGFFLIFYIVITIPLWGITLFFMLIFHTMRYELREDALYLRCGPFKSRIPYSEIKKISKTNLVFHPIASPRGPGFAFGDCYYADRGVVRMYSTRMCKDIILIETEKKLYGITPKDEELFINELKKRIEGKIT